MIRREGLILQQGMNYRIKEGYSIILMSVRKGAPYKDKWHDDTGLLEYEGHDEPRRDSIDPKKVDQPMFTASGKLTQNGKFYEAAREYQRGNRKSEIVQVYEKISQGIWCDRGRYELIDAKIHSDGDRNVFRFFLRPTQKRFSDQPFLRETRMIPTHVKVEVWKRDQGKCVICGSQKNLHFDHEIPFSKGGSSASVENVRLLCARHNLEKSNKIMCYAPWIAGIATAIMARPA